MCIVVGRLRKQNRSSWPPPPLVLLPLLVLIRHLIPRPISCYPSQEAASKEHASKEAASKDEASKVAASKEEASKEEAPQFCVPYLAQVGLRLGGCPTWLKSG